MSELFLLCENQMSCLAPLFPRSHGQMDYARAILEQAQARYPTAPWLAEAWRLLDGATYLCRHPNPSAFHPATRPRCPSASAGPSNPSSTL